MFLLNMGAAPATVNLAAAMGRAGLGAGGWASGVSLALDSADVAARKGERVDAAAITLQPWRAVLLTLRLDAHTEQ